MFGAGWRGTYSLNVWQGVLIHDMFGGVGVFIQQIFGGGGVLIHHMFGGGDGIQHVI